MHVARLVGDGETRVARRHAGTHGTGPPAAHAAGATGIEQFLEGQRHGIAVRVPQPGQSTDRQCILVGLADAERADRLQLPAHILCVREAAEEVFSVFSLGIEAGSVEEAHQVAGHVVLEAGVEIGHLGVDGGVSRKVEHAAAAQVEVAAEGVLQIRVLDILRERRVNARCLHGAELQRIELVIEFLADIPAESIRAGKDVAGILRPVLVAVRELDVHLGQVDERGPCDEIGIPGDIQAGRNGEFRCTYGIVDHELEVAAEAQREDFAAAEQVFVAIRQRGGDAQQSRGVERAFQIHLDGLQPGLLQQDTAVHGVGVQLGFAEHHIDAAEHGDAGEAVIDAVDLFLAIGFAGLQLVDVLQEFLAHAHAALGYEGDVADMIAAVGPGGFFAFVAGMVFNLDDQVGLVGGRRRIGVEEEVVFGKAPVAVIAEVLGDAFAFFFQGFFRQVIAALDGEVAGVCVEQFLQFRIAHLVVDRPDGESFSEGHVVLHLGLLVLDGDVGFDLGVVVSLVFEVVEHAGHGVVDQVLVEDDGRLADLLAESVPSFSIAVLPVIDVQQGMPVADDVVVGFLADIRVEARWVIGFVAVDDHFVLGQAYFVFGEHLRRGAPRRQDQHHQPKNKPAFPHILQIYKKSQIKWSGLPEARWAQPIFCGIRCR